MAVKAAFVLSYSLFLRSKSFAMRLLREKFASLCHARSRILFPGPQRFCSVHCHSMSARYAGKFIQQKKTSQVLLQSKLRLNQHQTLSLLLPYMFMYQLFKIHIVLMYLLRTVYGVFL